MEGWGEGGRGVGGCATGGRGWEAGVQEVGVKEAGVWEAGLQEAGRRKQGCRRVSAAQWSCRGISEPLALPIAADTCIYANCQDKGCLIHRQGSRPREGKIFGQSNTFGHSGTKPRI